MSEQPTKKWSAQVTKESDALDLKRHVFASNDPKKIALSLKASAEHSHRRKSSPFRSAMSMLTFYLNRAGKTLPAARRRTIERAKSAAQSIRPKISETAGISYPSKTTRTLLASCSRLNGLLKKFTPGSSTPPCTTALRV
jgi:hypothetical protein